MSEPLTTPIPAMTGTCPACGEAMGTRDGLARHNLHASAGERVYATSLVRFVGLAKLERRAAALLLLTLAACGRTITAPEGMCPRGMVPSATVDTLRLADSTSRPIATFAVCVKEGK